MNTLTKQRRRELVAQLDPLRPLEANDVRYVRLDEDPSEMGRVVRALYDTLDAAPPDGRSTQLFTGFPGTGKSTELRRLRHFLDQDRDTRTFTLLVDGEDYIDPFAELHVADVLRVLAYELDKAANVAEGKDADAPEGYLERFWQFLQTDVEIKNLKGKVPGVEAMAELRTNPTFRDAMRKALAARFQSFADQAHDFVRTAVSRLRKARGVERVVVLFDSLEKIRPLDSTQVELIEGSLERVFVQHADLLRVPCHVVYTFPLSLRYLVTGIGNHYGSEPVVMPMVSVCHEEDGAPNERGLEKLVQLLNRRLAPDPSAVLGPPERGVARRLAEASGGYPRDLIRLARNLVQNHTEFPVPDEGVTRVIDDLAAEYANVYRDTQKDVLRYVARHHRLPQADDDEMRLAATLIQRVLVLSYRNGAEWYDVHPLLRRHPRVAPIFA